MSVVLTRVFRTDTLPAHSPIRQVVGVFLLSTPLATNLYVLIALVVGGAYFIYSATVEERLMTATFPVAYPGYRARTKMLIPFVL